MWEYLAVLILGFWLGVAIFLYVSCYWLDEIFDLPQQRTSQSHIGASGAHAQLKRLVARVVEEAAALPALARYAAEPHTPSVSTTYEDLLATAILNKVIERYQTESGSGGRSSGIHSASASPSPSDRSSPRSLNLRNNRDVSPPLPEEEDDASDWEDGEATDEAVEVPRRVPFPEFGGDIVHASDNEFRDFDEVSGSDIQAVDGSWEENWLFQKKKIKNIQSAPVPMLVPNSNTQYRALIGDRDAEDTTDLSDNASDSEEHEEVEYKSDIKKVLDSKHIIGGKSKVDETLDFEPDSLTIIEDQDFNQITIEENKSKDTVDSTVGQKIVENGDIFNNHEHHDSILVISVDSGPLPKTEFNLKEQIHRTALNGHPENYTEENTRDDSIESSFTQTKESTNTLSRSEREKSYEETEAVPVQRYADSLRRKHFEQPQHSLSEKEDDLIPGSIADRERKKWLNFVEMPNNPYSPEAIKKRLSAKSTSSLFDSMTTKKDIVDEKLVFAKDNNERNLQQDSAPRVQKIKLSHSASTDAVMDNERKSISPLPKALQEVLSEEVPQYKRYGRDYYIKEARSSSGERKKSSFGSASSLSSSINKSTSLENFDRDFAPVSASSSLSDLEGIALHTSITRNVFSPRHASPNFAINPIFENPDRHECNETYNRHFNFPQKVDESFEELNYKCGYENVSSKHDAAEINDDVVRLKIPKTPEITDNLFENYADIRSNTMRSEYARKRRPGLNIAFGGSGLLIQQFNSIATNQQYTKFGGRDKENISITTMPNEYKNEILIEYEDANEHTLFPEKHQYVDEETDRKFEEILQSAYNSDKITPTDNEREKSPSVENSLSSSVEDSIKIYNVQTGEIVKCKPEDKLSRYATDRNDNIDIPDKNAGETQTFSEASDIGDDAVTIDSLKIEEGKVNDIDEIAPFLPNVRELAKKFVSMESLSEPIKVPQPVLKRQKSKDNILSSEKEKPSKLTYMHSLTARSISKEFREELKLSLATPLTIPGGSKDIPEGEEITRESSRPGSPVPEPGTIKTKLAFFESLKTKFTK